MEASKGARGSTRRVTAGAATDFQMLNFVLRVFRRSNRSRQNFCDRSRGVGRPPVAKRKRAMPDYRDLNSPDTLGFEDEKGENVLVISKGEVPFLNDKIL
jgi:hypothetical protein